MIPILYLETETDFTSNGLGGLSEMSECVVTEERNGKYELTAVYPVTGIHFKDLRCGRYIKAVPSEGKAAQPFEIVELTPSTSNTVQITAQHISYRLSRIPVKTRSTPVTSAAAALTALKSDALEDCPFTFWTDVTTQASYTTPTPASLRSRLGGPEGSVLDAYGGEYDWDMYDVKLYANRGEDTGALLAYGKNITSLEQETSIANMVTGIYPYWQGTKDDGSTVTVEADAPVYCDNYYNFPYRSLLAVDFSSDFQTQPTKEQLVERARKYITANHVGTPSVNLKVSFAALWQTEEYKELAAVERVRLCDTVTVRFDRLGVSAKAKVIATEYDVLKDRYNSIELGDAKSDFADTLVEHTGNSIAKSERRQRGFLDEAIAEATQKISGGRGGYVVLSRAADGTPDEILIMDTDNKSTAVNVLRINKNGIGFSSTGYDGEYKSAWTIDGHFVADFIASGTIQAALIKAGILSDAKGRNSWNMETGELNLNVASTIGGKAIASTDAVQAASDKAAKAQSAASTAQGTAESAQGTANAAASTADSAKSAASNAQTAADSANTAASAAQATADSAQSTANSAQSAANSAQSAANAAANAASTAQKDVDVLYENIHIDGEGMHLAKADSSGAIKSTYQTLVSDKGMRVVETATGTAALKTEGDTVEAANLVSRETLSVNADGYKLRWTKFHSSVDGEDGIGAYWSKT